MEQAAAWARLAVALLVVAATVYLMVRRVDVRLVLLGAGLVMVTAAGRPLALPDTFTRAMIATMVGPICASMGFAAVLGATGCDRHLVRLLLAPLRRAGWALVPGGVLAAYLVNLAVPSQTSAAAAVGPILVPLLLAAGVGPARAGAALLLGASFGGDLLNPGAQDVQAIAGATGIPARAVHARLALAGAAGVGVAAAVFALLGLREPPAAEPAPTPAGAAEEPLNVFKALIPLTPTALLLSAYAGLPGLGWLVQVPEGAEGTGLEGALPVVRAVLLGTALAVAVSWREAQVLTRQFFADMGSAYGSIIALTITAQCFGAGIAALGVGALLLELVGGTPWGLAVLSYAFPWGLAVLSGSGSGPVLAFAETFLKPLGGREDATTLAAVACLAGACGRTMSPVAAVVLYAAGLVGVSPLALVRRVLPALAAGAAVALAAVLLGLRLPVE